MTGLGGVIPQPVKRGATAGQRETEGLLLRVVFGAARRAGFGYSNQMWRRIGRFGGGRWSFWARQLVTRDGSGSLARGAMTQCHQFGQN
jgi:hypothetical protein